MAAKLFTKDHQEVVLILGRIKVVMAVVSFGSLLLTLLL